MMPGSDYFRLPKDLCSEVPPEVAGSSMAWYCKYSARMSQTLKQVDMNRGKPAPIPGALIIIIIIRISVWEFLIIIIV